MMKSLYITKINNLLTVCGGKHKSESIVVRCFKKLQKRSTKQAYEMLQTTIKTLTPVFRLQTLTPKKRRRKTGTLKKRVFFILKYSYRLTLAVKYVQEAIKTRDNTKACEVLTEILLTCELNNSEIYKKKQEYQQQVPFYLKFRKRIRRNYRWKGAS